MIVYRTRTCNTSCNTITLTYTTITSFMFDGLVFTGVYLSVNITVARAQTHIHIPTPTSITYTPSFLMAAYLYLQY